MMPNYLWLLDFPLKEQINYLPGHCLNSVACVVLVSVWPVLLLCHNLVDVKAAIFVPFNQPTTAHAPCSIICRWFAAAVSWQMSDRGTFGDFRLQPLPSNSSLAILGPRSIRDQKGSPVRAFSLLCTWVLILPLRHVTVSMHAAFHEPKSKHMQRGASCVCEVSAWDLGPWTIMHTGWSSLQKFTFQPFQHSWEWWHDCRSRVGQQVPAFSTQDETKQGCSKGHSINSWVYATGFIKH